MYERWGSPSGLSSSTGLKPCRNARHMTWSRHSRCNEPDHPLHERILPGCTRRRQHFGDAHGLRKMGRRRAVDPIAIPDEESRRGVPRPCFAELLCSPRGGRMRCHVDVNDAPALVRQHLGHKQHPKRGRRDGEEVHRGRVARRGWRGRCATWATANGRDVPETSPPCFPTA
jgi:hypothetical protein